MNIFERNFRNVIESWVTNFRLHRTFVKDRKAIRRHGKELKRARKLADELHESTGKAYYCLVDHEGNMRVLDKMGVRGLQKFKVMSKDVTFIDLLIESEYNTLNNHFVVLRDWQNGQRSYEYFRGTITKCIEKYSHSTDGNFCEIQILGGYERIVTITNGKIVKH